MFPVVKSDSPLIFDTLPDLKARYFRFGTKTPSIYTYAQFYFLKNSLWLSLRGFQQTPPPQSGLCFALCAGAGLLQIRLFPGKAQLCLPGHSALPLCPPNIARFAGQDEHGWYWGAQLCVQPPQLALIGFAPQIGAQFGAAVFKTQLGFGVIGASYPLPHSGKIINPALFNRFVVSPV